MAIVQISRIQHRRGLQENLPQLSHAELGWVTDTRSLYIGNGPTSSGAPIVGNTQLLTEHSNIVSLLNYTYEGNATSTVQTGTTTALPTVRKLQDRLDDYVSVMDFGAVGNGSVDDWAAIDRAMYELFIKDTTQKARRSLYFPAGVYKVTAPVRLPTWATIFGDGSGKTFIQYEETQTNATATATISAGAVTGFTGIVGGVGYETAPVVKLTGGGGASATATATITAGVVTSIAITAGGSGYSSAPAVEIESTSTKGHDSCVMRTVDSKGQVSPNIGSNSAIQPQALVVKGICIKSTDTNVVATATAVAGTGGSNALLTANITLTNGGTGFVFGAPTVTITGGNGASATATATLTGSVVTAITITAGGTGYTTAPTITISKPKDHIMDNIQIDSTLNSYFEDVAFYGAYTNQYGLPSPLVPDRNDRPAAIKVTQTNALKTRNITFRNCQFLGVPIGVYSNYPIEGLNFTNCNFDVMYKGLWLGENTPIGACPAGDGPTSFKIMGSLFRNIDFEAIDVVDGTGIYSIGNTFDNVGNNNAGDGTAGAVSDVISYSSTNVSNCSSITDNFKRVDGDVGVYDRVAINDTDSYVNIVNKKQIFGKHELRIPTTKVLATNTTATTDLTFAEASINNVRISYKLTRHAHSRVGVLDIVTITGARSISDDYEETGATDVLFTVTSSGGFATLNYQTTGAAGTGSLVTVVEIIN